jgi:protein ImuA
MSMKTPASIRARTAVLDDLRSEIHRIERREDRLGEGAAHGTGHGLKGRAGPAWTSGAGEIDDRLGPAGLETYGVHEVKPILPPNVDWAANWAAVRAFALALTGRRCAARDREGGPRPFVLCCWSLADARELGAPYGPGLAAFGIDPRRLLFAETTKIADTLWTLEEGLKSESLALALGILEEVAPTPARRLALAAAAHRTPCLLLTHPRAAATAATATRWRVGPSPSAPHPFDARAPGAARFTLALERCRARPASAAVSWPVEWCDDAFRFRVAAGLADRAAGPRRTQRGIG